MAEAQWIDLCALSDLPREGGWRVVCDGRALAVFRVRGDGADEVRVLDDRCPHAGGSLSAGSIDRTLRDPGSARDLDAFATPDIPPGHTGCVICPVHALAFDLDTGRCPEEPDPRLSVRVYPARVVAGRVEAQLSLG
jgi:nitrite reductase/ring-hydroxylating ferredoxin subunit